jgi:hypothetical protein
VPAQGPLSRKLDPTIRPMDGDVGDQTLQHLSMRPRLSSHLRTTKTD